MDVINYKNSILNLSNSILKYFDINPYHDTLKEVDKILEKNNYENIIVLLCDGLGAANLEYALSKNTFLRQHQIKNITSVFPPTTTAATTSFLTGLYPSEHNWYGWDMYFKDKNETISLYLNKVKETKKNPKLDVSKRDYMEYKTIIDLIKEKNEKAYILSPFDQDNTCCNLDEVCDKILKLTKESGKKFIYGYIENPDKLIHKYGIYSKIVVDKIREINNKIEELSTKLQNTIIFVIADHGLISTKYINLKKDIPEIYNMLKRTTSLESRASGIKLKRNNLKEEFERLYNLNLKQDFHLLTKEEVIKVKLFGNDSNQYLEDNIGDYLLIAKSNKSINYDDSSPIFKANHAGLTRGEIIVPLIVIEKNKFN